MASVLPNAEVTRVTSVTKLSELQRLVRERRANGGRVRLVRSIQQSMRVEGYDVPQQVIGAAVDRVLGDHGRR